MFRRVFGVAFATVIGLAVAFPIKTASAVTVTIAVQEDGGAVVPQLPAGVGFDSISGVFGDFLITSASGTGSPPLGATQLLSSTANITSLSDGAHNLKIFVTVSDITSPINLVPFLSSLTSNILSEGSSLVLSTLFSSVNALFTGVLLASNTFTGPIINDTFADVDPTNVLLAPYSLTAVFDFSTTAAEQGALATISVTVPGPIVGAGLPGLLAACVGLILLARRRRGLATA